MSSSTIDFLFDCFTRACLDSHTRKEIKSGVKHWKKAMKGCLKFIRLDRDSKREQSLSREKFGGGNVHHILFTKTDARYENYRFIFNRFCCP